MLRHFGKMLEVFPFSKLAKVGPVLRVYAIEYKEPPLFERHFDPGVSVAGHDRCLARVRSARLLRRNRGGLGPVAAVVTIGSWACGGYALLSRLRIRARE